MTPAANEYLSGRQPKAVHSALQVLEEVARRGAGVTAKEVAHALRLPPATTYRLLNILVAEGYLVRLPDLHGFALGRKLGGLLGAAAPLPVCSAARQVVADLRNQVRFGVHLVVYSGTTVRIADVDPDHPFGAGQLLTRYLHASAIGKLLLSEQDDWRAIWPESWLRSATELTVTSASEFESDLARVRETGFAHQSGQLRPESACMAVPVRSVTGALVGAIAVSAPVERAEALEPLAGLVSGFADRLSTLLA
jgi:DNA-binding IclR family transcriptional regulator